MYKLGYLDDDKGNRTSFARQFDDSAVSVPSVAV